MSQTIKLQKMIKHQAGLLDQHGNEGIPAVIRNLIGELI